MSRLLIHCGRVPGGPEARTWANGQAARILSGKARDMR